MNRRAALAVLCLSPIAALAGPKGSVCKGGKGPGCKGGTYVYPKPKAKPKK